MGQAVALWRAEGREKVLVLDGEAPRIGGGRRGAAAISPLGLTGWAPELQKAKVYEQILLDVILGVLAPGAKLDEQDLARRYGCGLAGIRDALGRLALEGLVVRLPRSSTTVAPLDLADVRQAYEARQLIEPHCAALAAKNATADDIAAMAAAFEGGDAAARASDPRALIDMDQRFHAALASATGNLTLAKILIPLQHKAARFWVYSMVEDTVEDRLAEVARHRMVLDCIKRGDAECAKRAMLDILGVFADTVRRSAGDGPQAAPLALA
jgi:DNA-binding GntR family transcriptional regulator